MTAAARRQTVLLLVACLVAWPVLLPAAPAGAPGGGTEPAKTAPPANAPKRPVAPVTKQPVKEASPTGPVTKSPSAKTGGNPAPGTEPGKTEPATPKSTGPEAPPSSPEPVTPKTEPDPEPKREPVPQPQPQPRRDPVRIPVRTEPPPADERGTPLPEPLRAGLADRFAPTSDQLLPAHKPDAPSSYPHLADTAPVPVAPPEAKTGPESPGIWARLSASFGSSRTLVNVIVLAALVIIFVLYRLRAGRGRYP